jgi:hypothetical protein
MNDSQFFLHNYNQGEIHPQTKKLRLTCAGVYLCALCKQVTGALSVELGIDN